MIPRPLELSLHKILSEKKEKKFLLAVSGGLDSMALFHAFGEMAKKLPITFVAAHVHHGPSDDKEQNFFRDKALQFVQKKCSEKKVQCWTNANSPRSFLKSEQDFRRFRLEQLAQAKKETKSDYVVFSHHKEDLLETRLIRLMRGTGPEGMVAMQTEKGAVLRPFLGHSKTQMEQYLQILKENWVEDPSNIQTRYLRNWLRNKWLPALEKKRPGSISALERSLQSLAESFSPGANLESCFDEKGLLREEFLLLGLADKRRVLGVFLRHQKCDNFGLSHINEMIKRLDVEQKNLTFRLLKKNWRANARHIWCEG